MGDEIFRVHDGFVVRTPLRSGAARLPAAPGGPGPEACRDVLRAAADRAELAEAIEVASPSLAAVLADARTGRLDARKPAQLRRAALAVLKYDLRSRTRPTPFGLFAGVSAGRFDVAPKVEDDGPARTRTRVDLGWLREVVEAAEPEPGLLPHLDVQAHSTVVRRGDRLHLDTPSAGAARPFRCGAPRRSRPCSPRRGRPVPSRTSSPRCGTVPGLRPPSHRADRRAGAPGRAADVAAAAARRR